MQRQDADAGLLLRDADIAAAASLLAALGVATAGALLLDPPTSSEFAAADPLLRWAGASFGPWQAPAAAVLVASLWIARARFDPRTFIRQLGLFVLGAAAAGAGAVIVRIALGPMLPAFVPPEESARTGLALGLSAGLLEEASFRFALLPVFYSAALRRFSPNASAALAILTTGLAFAVAHELAAGRHDFDLGHSFTRFVFPGCLMSLLFFRPGPAFILGLHWSAHVAIARFFVTATG